MEIKIGSITIVPGIVCEKCWSHTVIYPLAAYEKHLALHGAAVIPYKRRSHNPSGRPPGNKKMTLPKGIKIR